MILLVNDLVDGVSVKHMLVPFEAHLVGQSARLAKAKRQLAFWHSTGQFALVLVCQLANGASSSQSKALEALA